MDRLEGRATGSPSKQNTPSTHQLSSPRSAGRLRQMKSAHNLSTNYSAQSGPSLIAQQRQQQQLQQQQNLRHHAASKDGSIPPIPPLPQLPPVPPVPSPQKHFRSRSNSEAVLSNPASTEASPRKPLAPRKNASPREELEALIKHGPSGNTPAALQDLRHWILCEGMDADSDGMSHLRIYVWLILLDAPPLPTDSYLALTKRGPSPAHAKICNDTFRTFKTNPLFKRRVTDNSLVRLLNAVAWRLHDAKQEATTAGEKITNSSDDQGSPILEHANPFPRSNLAASTAATETSEFAGLGSGIYVQGMNVLCAPFLYVARSEPEAFVAFHLFITRECPGYVRGAMDGVHKGIALVDRCLAFVDPKLSSYLVSKGVRAEVYAFASVLTMCAGTPPLPEVLKLWDFLLGYGAHLNILCICSQLMAMREELLASPNPGPILRSFPPLDARKIITLTVGMVRKIPEDLYEELVEHAQ